LKYYRIRDAFDEATNIRHYYRQLINDKIRGKVNSKELELFISEFYKECNRQEYGIIVTAMKWCHDFEDAVQCEYCGEFINYDYDTCDVCQYRLCDDCVNKSLCGCHIESDDDDLDNN